MLFRPCASRRARRMAFTLVELLVAMALVVVVVLLSYKFFSNLQSVWQHSVGRTNTHEDGRLALGLIAADLEAAVARADDRPGFDICFHQPSDTELWFVTDAAADTTVDCPLVEVAYRLEGNSFQRAFVDQSNAAWNVYGERDNADDQDGFITVIDGVTALQFRCYDAAGLVMTPSQSTRLPALVCVMLSVLDARDLKRWQTLPLADRPAFVKQNARTFWKTIRTR